VRNKILTGDVHQMKDAYTEMSLDEFKILSDEERQFATFMTLKEINNGLKKSV
jgi:hypothetical protein